MVSDIERNLINYLKPTDWEVILSEFAGMSNEIYNYNDAVGYFCKLIHRQTKTYTLYEILHYINNEWVVDNLDTVTNKRTMIPLLLYLDQWLTAKIIDESL